MATLLAGHPLFGLPLRCRSLEGFLHEAERGGLPMRGCRCEAADVRLPMGTKVGPMCRQELGPKGKQQFGPMGT